MAEYWRQGRRCATCVDYSQDNGQCSRYDLTLPCYPGFDEMDRGMRVKLDCWTHQSDNRNPVEDPIKDALLRVIQPARRVI